MGVALPGENFQSIAGLQGLRIISSQAGRLYIFKSSAKFLHNFC